MKITETDNQKMNCDHYRKRNKNERRTLPHPAQKNDCEAHDQHISGQNKENLCEGGLWECKSENVSDVPDEKQSAHALCFQALFAIEKPHDESWKAQIERHYV